MLRHKGRPGCYCPAQKGGYLWSFTGKLPKTKNYAAPLRTLWRHQKSEKCVFAVVLLFMACTEVPPLLLHLYSSSTLGTLCSGWQTARHVVSCGFHRLLGYDFTKSRFWKTYSFGLVFLVNGALGSPQQKNHHPAYLGGLDAKGWLLSSFHCGIYERIHKIFQAFHHDPIHLKPFCASVVAEAIKNSKSTNRSSDPSLFPWGQGSWKRLALFFKRKRKNELADSQEPLDFADVLVLLQDWKLSLGSRKQH